MTVINRLQFQEQSYTHTRALQRSPNLLFEIFPFLKSMQHNFKRKIYFFLVTLYSITFLLGYVRKIIDFLEL